MPQITKSVYDIIEITSRGGVSPNNTTAYNSAKEASSYYDALDKAYWDSVSWLSTPHLEQNRSEIYDDEEPYSFIGYRWEISRILLYWDISEIPDCGEITEIKMNYGIDHFFNPDNKLIFQVQRGELIYPHYPVQSGDFNEDNYETINEFDLSDKGYSGNNPVSIEGDLITDEEFISDLNTYPKEDIRLMLRMLKDVEGEAIERTIKMTDGSWTAPYLPEIIITWTERPEIDNLQITVLPNGNISAEAEITNIRCSNCDTRGFSAVFSQAELSTAEKDELETFFDELGWDYYSTYYPSSGWWVDAWKDYEEYGSFGVGSFSMELGELPAGFDYDIYAYCENEGGYTSTDGVTVTINPYNVTTLRAELRAESSRAYTNVRLYGNIEEVAE